MSGHNIRFCEEIRKIIFALYSIPPSYLELCVVNKNIYINMVLVYSDSGEPGLVDRVLAMHAGSRGFDSHRGHMSERFF